MPPAAPLRLAVETLLPGLADQTWSPLSGGRTNRLWLVDDIVVKAYDPARASRLFPNDPGAELRAMAMLGPLGLAPILMGHGNGWVAYRHIAGASWRGDPRPVAVMLRRLHSLSAQGFRPVASGSAALIQQTQAILSDCRGRPFGDVQIGDVPPSSRQSLIHGDPVPGNLIDGPAGITLIDWQCPALGDPAEDLAIFLSPAMQFLYRGSVLAPEERQAFLSAYGDPAVVERFLALLPAFRNRMAAHCLWRAEHGDADYARALRLELAA